MDSLAVHEILSTNLYRISKPDTFVVYGKEIIKDVEHSRLFADSVITINPSSFYTYVGEKDSLMLTGQQILDTFPLAVFQPFYPIMAWGACFFGMVIGWNLYFINEKRAEANININDLGIIVAALANGVLLNFFDNSNRLLGWYGFGLGFGFLLFGIYLIILGNLGDKGRSSVASDLFKLHTGQSIDKK